MTKHTVTIEKGKSGYWARMKFRGDLLVIFSRRQDTVLYKMRKLINDTYQPNEGFILTSKQQKP